MTNPKKSDNKIISFLLLIVILSFAGFIVYRMIYFHFTTKALNKTFSGSFQQFTDPNGFKENIQSPYTTGKVFVINNVTGEIPLEINEGLDEFQAKSPNDVGTIIWVNCNEKVVGTYSSGAQAFTYVCDLTIIDKNKRMIINKEQIISDDKPPETKFDKASWHAIMPYSKIAKIIKSLPRK